MRRFSVYAVLAVLPLLALVLSATTPRAEAQQSSAQKAQTRTALVNVSAAAADVVSAIAATDRLVVRSVVVTSNAAGTLTFTDGLAGDALLIVYVAANVRVDLTPELIGPAGIRLTRGNELSLNVLGSATAVSLCMSTTLE